MKNDMTLKLLTLLEAQGWFLLILIQPKCLSCDERGDCRFKSDPEHTFWWCIVNTPLSYQHCYLEQVFGADAVKAQKYDKMKMIYSEAFSSDFAGFYDLFVQPKYLSWGKGEICRFKSNWRHTFCRFVFAPPLPPAQKLITKPEILWIVLGQPFTYVMF